MWYDPEKLKKVRKANRNPNQDLVGEAIGCGRSNYSKIENGATVTIRQITDIAKYFGVVLSELFEFTGEEKIFIVV